ncbi:type II secretion system protein N [Pseudomonas sp. NPDC090202]|uniref:type II secretion system protein N n=1 Tax=unclassified Pseudomonas TaxID=196821 RepID=UPI0037F9FA0D
MTIVAIAVCGGWLAWREHGYRQALASAPWVPPTTAKAAVSSSGADPAALIAVMGLRPEGTPSPSREALILRGTFVSGPEHSGALLATDQGQRVYRTGERLPGGSVLRRIEIDRVLLWRNGREEVVALNTAPQQVLKVTSSPTHSTSSYLRPLAVVPRDE